MILERGERKKREKGKETSIPEKNTDQLVASHTCPDQELNPQPRHVL